MGVLAQALSRSRRETTGAAGYTWSGTTPAPVPGRSYCCFWFIMARWAESSLGCGPPPWTGTQNRTNAKRRRAKDTDWANARGPARQG
jgi:hypothetical protein